MTNDEARMTNLRSQIPDLKSQISDLRSEMPDLKSEMPGLRSQIRCRGAARGSRLAAAGVLAASLLTLVVSAGCGMPASRKPALYQVRGRVVDAETRLGVPNARILLRAALATTLGTKVLSVYGVADADGKYAVELSEPFETVRYASQIRVDASKRGYAPSGVELPPPAGKQPFYPVPDIPLGRAGGPVPPDVPSPGGILRQPPPKKSPLPWK